MSHRTKRTDELLAALAVEFELLGSENAALVKELEALREQVGMPVSSSNTLSSRQATLLPSKPARHLGPLSDAFHGQEELPADPPANVDPPLSTLGTVVMGGASPRMMGLAGTRHSHSSSAVDLTEVVMGGASPKVMALASTKHSHSSSAVDLTEVVMGAALPKVIARASSKLGQEGLPTESPVVADPPTSTGGTIATVMTVGGASPKVWTPGAASPKRKAAAGHFANSRFDPFMHTNSELLVEERYENFYDLSRAFHTLCAKHKITINAREICEMDLNQQGESAKDVPQHQESIFAQTIAELNKDLRLATRSKQPSQEVMLETYSMIMSGNKAEAKLERAGKDIELIEAVTKMRDILLKEDAIRKIALATGAGWEDMYVPNKDLANTRMESCLRYIDPFVGFVILCNAVVIGVSADWYVGNVAWDWCEIGFTLIFCIEVIVKVHVRGYHMHFLGHDMLWNIFDFVVVTIAVTDLIVTLLGGLQLLDNFTLVRLLRFARLTKLVRVLKLKVFKELALLVNGCFAGFRTLFWAIVFLAFILFALGVLLKGFLGEHEAVYYPKCPNSTYFPEVGDDDREDRADCVRSALQLDRYRMELFGSVPRSMFTVFRCFTDGCNFPDGTPLVPTFYNTHGLHLILVYMLCFLFVIFGLFNLIMAVFVENTIENAKHDEERRREARTHEHIRVARKLQEVILMFCAGERTLTDARLEADGEQGNGVFGWFKRVFSTRWTLKDSLLQSQLFDEQMKISTSNLSLKVTSSSFHKILAKPEVQQLLDDLDIGYSSRGALFDVLDANCNGVLEVNELVHGLLKLRGAAEKGDIIASLLAIRSLQRNMKALELLGLKQQDSIDTLYSAHERMESHVRRISRATNAAPSTTSLRDEA